MRKETKLIVVLSNPVFPHRHQNIVILFFSSLYQTNTGFPLEKLMTNNGLLCFLDTK